MYRDDRLANSPRWYLKPPKDAYMRVPDDLLKSVCFVGLETQEDDGRKTYHYGGTAFIVGVPSADESIAHPYLVTAAHVAEHLAGKHAFVRLNPEQGPAVPVSIEPSERWYFHPTDPYADVAVIPLVMSFRYWFIPESMFLTPLRMAEDNVGIGDEIALIGLFAKVTGQARNLPIVRTGSIAMIPPERIPIKWVPLQSNGKSGDMEAFLIEARSIQGISGSPIFTLQPFLSYESPAFPGLRLPEPRLLTRVGFLGLMHGHWDIPPPSQAEKTSSDAIEGVEEANATINMGIALVVPAKSIEETLNHPELIEQRQEFEEMRRRGNAPSPDSLPTTPATNP